MKTRTVKRKMARDGKKWASRNGQRQPSGYS